MDEPKADYRRRGRIREKNIIYDFRSWVMSTPETRRVRVGVGLGLGLARANLARLRSVMVISRGRRMQL